MKTKIQTSIYQQPGNPGFTCMFKVTHYNSDGEIMFTMNIRPRPCIGKTNEIAKSLLLDGIQRWIKKYDVDVNSLDIRNKDIDEKLVNYNIF